MARKMFHGGNTMFTKSILVTGVAAALALVPAPRAQADAGDFIGGAIVGGLIGHAITKDQQRRKAQSHRSTSTRNYRAPAPRIPVTEHGRTTQTALNYFGFEAGRVDGQIGRGTRSAIERYQAAMGYPVNGRAFDGGQYDFLMQAHSWAINGGQAQTRLTGQPLLMAYRQQRATGQSTQLAAMPTVPVQPQAAATVAPAAQLPNLFAGQAQTVSLANHCNAVMLQTSTNGGYVTRATLTNGDFALSEQFCLARSYAIAQGEDVMSRIQALSPDQVASQCAAYGERLAPQVAGLSLRGPAEVTAEMRGLALSSGVPPADLAATSRVCLSVGYGRDDMDMALGSALLLVALGEPAYGELLGHHLREGFGTSERPDLARQWYDTSLNAIDAGARVVFMPSDPNRTQLLRAAMADQTADNPVRVQQATLPTFALSD
ncbi:peptidoglycan-binding domain-containing protein [Lutimaribacter marinistellae]|uniref:Peptidoglycan-binding domain-containing protein n=1 Tax=Lutimaribacter marinistellae TaxID=1820329 RepID=A0ABV7TFA0_9RHOB